MKKTILYSLLILTSFFSCNRVPISGRSQLLLVSDDEMHAMALTNYKEFLDTNKVVPPTSQQAQMVKRVGEKIARAANQYFASIGEPDYLANYNWQTELVESRDVNAWCMPGGKMVVYTGILPITQNETALAVVMGHEVSHAVAKHGAERMSQGMLAQGLLTAGQVGLGIAMANNPGKTNTLWQTAMGLAPVGVQLGMLAHGRNQESEADHLGLIFMSIAGYNPNEAVPFWQRMAAHSGNSQRPPVFLSTHPTDEQRIADIQKELPQAMEYYNKSKK